MTRLAIAPRLSGEGIREYLVRLYPSYPYRTAVRALTSVATDEELEQGWHDPAMWDELTNRWLLADASRRTATGLSYRAKARVAVGVSRGYGPRKGSMW